MGPPCLSQPFSSLHLSLSSPPTRSPSTSSPGLQLKGQFLGEPGESLPPPPLHTPGKLCALQRLLPTSKTLQKEGQAGARAPAAVPWLDLLLWNPPRAGAPMTAKLPRPPGPRCRKAHPGSGTPGQMEEDFWVQEEGLWGGGWSWGCRGLGAAAFHSRSFCAPPSLDSEAPAGAGTDLGHGGRRVPKEKPLSCRSSFLPSVATPPLGVFLLPWPSEGQRERRGQEGGLALRTPASCTPQNLLSLNALPHLLPHWPFFPWPPHGLAIASSLFFLSSLTFQLNPHLPLLR